MLKCGGGREGYGGDQGIGWEEIRRSGHFVAGTGSAKRVLWCDVSHRTMRKRRIAWRGPIK
jgi:hypothetical protein